MNSTILSLFMLLCSNTLLKVMTGEVPCAPVQHRECTGITSNATLVGAYISGCTKEPCVFTRGGEVTLEVDVEFNRPAQGLQAFLYASIFGAEVNWPDLDKNACNYIVSDGDCPVNATNYLTYGVTLGVRPQYPTIKTDVKFMLKDENGDTLVCWIVRVHVE